MDWIVSRRNACNEVNGFDEWLKWSGDKIVDLLTHFMYSRWVESKFVSQIEAKLKCICETEMLLAVVNVSMFKKNKNNWEVNRINIWIIIIGTQADPIKWNLCIGEERSFGVCVCVCLCYQNHFDEELLDNFLWYLLGQRMQLWQNLCCYFVLFFNFRWFCLRQYDIHSWIETRICRHHYHLRRRCIALVFSHPYFHCDCHRSHRCRSSRQRALRRKLICKNGKSENKTQQETI